MSVKTIHEYTCDRCGKVFQGKKDGTYIKRHHNGTRYELKMYWDTPQEVDLCSYCTDQFTAWWNQPQNPVLIIDPSMTKGKCYHCDCGEVFQGETSSHSCKGKQDD